MTLRRRHLEVEAFKVRHLYQTKRAPVHLRNGISTISRVPEKQLAPWDDRSEQFSVLGEGVNRLDSKQDYVNFHRKIENHA